MTRFKNTILSIGIILGVVIALSTKSYTQDNSANQDVLGDSFTKYISFNGEQSLIAYYVPDSYDSLVPSKMILALHYCGGSGASDAIIYRNLLRDLADMINAIVVAPYCHNTGSPSYTIPDPSIITVSIDSTREFLNVDTNYIYLTGGSCNGRSAFKYGLDEIYDFIGIIPFNAYMPSIAQGYYNFDSEIPSCICSGTVDPSYNNNVRMFDSLVAHNVVTYMNSMEGIGHEFNFPGFTDEMKECIDFIDSVSLVPTFTSPNKYLERSILIYPNPVKDLMNIQIISESSDMIRIESFDATGRMNSSLYEGTLIEGSNKISIPVTAGELSRGLNIIKISTNRQVVFKKVIARL
ncbi:MAG: T9SS type A sorting domain-containing protein [Cyclobacteriaceae bacterium]|nr:T9SS type A sorting domain-containing protein [Cyclobacteriaceae bacterium]